MDEYKEYESGLLMQNSLGSLSPNSIRLFPTDSTKQLSLARPQDLEGSFEPFKKPKRSNNDSSYSFDSSKDLNDAFQVPMDTEKIRNSLCEYQLARENMARILKQKNINGDVRSSVPFNLDRASENVCMSMSGTFPHGSGVNKSMNLLDLHKRTTDAFVQIEGNIPPKVEFKTLKGSGTLQYSNGDVYQGQFVDNDFTGYGIMIFGSNGDVYEGQWRDSQMCGQGRYIYASGDCFEGQFVKSKFNGFGVLTYRDGTMYQGEFVNDVAHGSGCLTYFDDNSEQTVTLRGYFYRGHYFGDNISAIKYRHDRAHVESPTITEEQHYREVYENMTNDCASSPIPRPK